MGSDQCQGFRELNCFLELCPPVTGESTPLQGSCSSWTWLQVVSLFSLLLPEILFVSWAVTLSERLLNVDFHPHSPHFQLHLYSPLCSSSPNSDVSNTPHLLKSSHFSANANIFLVIFEGHNLLWWLKTLMMKLDENKGII